MYFIEFPVSATNIFPLANSEAGGQLLSEYNLRSRETVATDPSVKYAIGPSYAHSMDDFALQSSATGAGVSSSVIQISPGRAIVNGHYVESLAPITIDLAAVNLKASQENVPELKGDLAIGLVMMYSNYTTLAGSAKVENSDGYYEGVQVVIVPETEMRRPVEVPEEHQYDEVNMHLLLGTFSYAGGRVSSVHDSLDKVKIFDASRIGDISTSLSETYLSKTGLDPHHLYVFAGKGTTDDNKDTWCLADDSLMIWDSDPRLKPNEPHSSVAHFEYNPTDHNTNLVLPHKQIDGAKDMEGKSLYFPDKVYPLPIADFNDNSGGVVTPAYTNRIKHIEELTNQYYRIPNGRMRKYIPELTKIEDLPKIPIGDGSVVPFDPTPIISDIESDIVGVKNTIYSVSGDTAVNRKLNTFIGTVNTCKNNISDYKDNIVGYKNTIVTNTNAILAALSNNSAGDNSIAEYATSILNSVSEIDNQISSSSSSNYSVISTKMTSSKNTIHSVINVTTGKPDLPGCATKLTGVLDIISSPDPDSDAMDEAIDDTSEVINAIRGTGSYTNNGIMKVLDTAEGNLDTAINAATNLQSSISSNTANIRTNSNSIKSLVDSSTAKGNAIITLCVNINQACQSISTECNSITTAISNISPALITLSNCADVLDDAVTKLGNMVFDFKNYIREEVERQVDEKSVLTTSVWSPGDYVLVGQDMVYQWTDGTYPSTMYVVNYGKVLTIGYVGTVERTIHCEEQNVYDEELLVAQHTVPPSLAGGAELYSVDISDPSSAGPTLFDYKQFHGSAYHDYFVARYLSKEDETTHTRQYKAFFYTPTSTDIQLDYITPPLMVTGGIHLATQDSVGGFLDAPDDALGQGYVVLDENGRLRVADFNLLLMGIEAQQLGQDIDEIGSGLDAQGIQDALDEQVNDRICYPNATQRANFTDPATGVYTTKDPHVIEITITLPSGTDASTITIHDVGSRAGSSLYVHLQGTATSATTVIFENCDKLRIDDSIQGSPNIILNNVNLYYSANVLDYTPSDGVTNLSLWYEKFWGDSTAPDLQVDGMTVTLLGDISRDAAIDPWDDENPNDNHYSYALRSLTFASDGTVINFGLIVGDSSTVNVDITDHALFRSTFTLPQSAGLQYPVTKMRHQLKVTGEFVSCYYDYSREKYAVKQTSFSALTQKYTSAISVIDGSIAFCTNSYYVSQISGVAVGEGVDCWDLNTPHIFFGGSVE